METPKRNLQQTSPDIFVENTPKKPTTRPTMSATNTAPANVGVNTVSTAAAVNFVAAGATTLTAAATTAPPVADCFSWEKLSDVLDAKLENVVKKDDLASVSNEVRDLRCQNNRLQQELQTMKSRLEQVDKASRRNNVVVSGLKSKFVQHALKEFDDICASTLRVAVNVVEARKIASGKSFLLSLNSAKEVNEVLSARKNLTGSNIYIDKDYTMDERSKRYFLRQVGKNAKNADRQIKIRYGDSRLYVDDKPFYCADEKIIAANKADAEFLRKLLSKANYACDIEVKEVTKPNTVPAAASAFASNIN